MNKQIIKQELYWDKETDNFDAIYTAQKSAFGKLLDSIFRKDMFERFIFTMENAIPIENRTFLDVGCGTGRYSLELARRGAAKVTGIDISDNMIAKCRNTALREALDSRTSFVNSDLLNFGSKEKYDVGIAIGLFDYIRDPSPVIKKMKDLTNDKVIMSFPRRYSWRAPLRKVRLFIKNCSVYFYSLDEVNKLVNKAGFKGCHVAVIGQLYCVIAFVK